MGLLIHRILVLVLALTFAGSGVAARQCEAAHHSVPVPAPLSQAAHAGNVAHDAQASHDHHDHGDVAGHAVDGSEDGNVMVVTTGPEVPAGGHDCDNKCAGMCTVVYGVVAGLRTSDVFLSQPARFFCGSGLVAFGSVKVDPGIPKRIV